MCAALQVVTYVVARPAREVLFTAVPTESKYHAKLCIDTLILRTGDVMGAWVWHAAQAVLQLNDGGMAAAAVPLTLCWAFVAAMVGRRHWLASQSKPA